MSRVQHLAERLSIRAESAEILTQAIDGERQAIPIDASTLSRYANADCANPVEMLVAMIDALPADRGAMLLAFLEDAYERRHGTADDTSLEELFERLDALDCGEDGVRFLAASRQYEPADLRQWLRRNREYDSVADRARRVASRRLAESRGRKPAHRAGTWTQTRKERTG